MALGAEARKPAERVLYRATRDGFKVIGRAGRTFSAAQRLGKPARPRKSGGAGLFDLTPTDEQQMLVEAWRARRRSRVARLATLEAADGAPATALDSDEA